MRCCSVSNVVPHTWHVYPPPADVVPGMDCTKNHEI
jgi:hypothetical protein